MSNVDLEGHHEAEEADIHALIGNIEAEEERPQRATQGEKVGAPGVPFLRSQGDGPSSSTPPPRGGHYSIEQIDGMQEQHI